MTNKTYIYQNQKDRNVYAVYKSGILWDFINNKLINRKAVDNSKIDMLLCGYRLVNYPPKQMIILIQNQIKQSYEKI